MECCDLGRDIEDVALRCTYCSSVKMQITSFRCNGLVVAPKPTVSQSRD
jgi:hypothetical protein